MLQLQSFLKYLRQDWLLVAEILLFGSFTAADASSWIGTIAGTEIDTRWVYLAAILVVGLTAIRRLGSLRDELSAYKSHIRVTARLSSLAANVPDPGPGKTSLRAGVVWEVWANQDVSTDQLALNVIYEYDRLWWQFWKKTRFSQKGLARDGSDTTEYRTRIRAAGEQPYRDHGVFHYVADREITGDPHWLLELVLRTGTPHGEHRVPVFIDREELRTRGTYPPL